MTSDPDLELYRSAVYYATSPGAVAWWLDSGVEGSTFSSYLNDLAFCTGNIRIAVELDDAVLYQDSCLALYLL